MQNIVELQGTCMIYYFDVFGFVTVVQHATDTTIVILLTLTQGSKLAFLTTSPLGK